MPLTTAETQTLFLRDPAGTRRGEWTTAIQRLPADWRAVATMRSALSRALSDGVGNEEVSRAWKKVNDYANQLNKIQEFVFQAWDIARRRGDVSGPIPTTTIASPDRPAGLGDYITAIAVVGGMAALLAGIVLAVVFVSSTWPVWVAIAGGVIVIAALARDAVVEVARSPASKEIAAAVGQTASAGGNIAIAVAFIAALWFLAPRRKA